MYLSHNADNGLLQEIRKALKLDEEVKGDFPQESMSHSEAKQKIGRLSEKFEEEMKHVKQAQTDTDIVKIQEKQNFIREAAVDISELQKHL